MTDELLTTKQAMARMHVGVRTLRRLRAEGKLSYLQISEGIIRYRASDCDAYLASCLRVNTPPTAIPPPHGKTLSTSGGGFMAMRNARLAAKRGKTGAK